MPKSRKKHRKKSDPGGSGHIPYGGAAGKSVQRLNIVIAALAVVALGAAATYWYLDTRVERPFLALAAQGRADLDKVVSHPSTGQKHLVPGETYAYTENFPTSGPHAPVPTSPGFYESQQPPVNLVHAIEHGGVLIYYDAPGDEVLATLRDWTALYPGKWDGVLAAPMAGLGEGLVVNAWTKELRLERFDAPAVAAFIDAYRGRGPENPVR